MHLSKHEQPLESAPQAGLALTVDLCLSEEWARDAQLM